MTLIALEKLHPDPRNANVCGPDTLEKLRRHMERSNFCPALLVRPHPDYPNQYIVVDGHQRLMVAASLDWPEIDCQIKEMTEDEASLLLLTLNRLRGTDVPRKRAELIESLLGRLTLDDLSLMLPESSAELEGLLALLKQDETALEKALKAQMEAEEKTLPVPFGFMVAADDAPLIREALAFYQAKRSSEQGDALVAICRDALSLHQVESTDHDNTQA